MPTLPPNAKGKPQPFAPVFRDLQKLLKEAGATKLGVVRKVEEHTPKAPAAAAKDDAA
jgi:hypothetical protein